MIKVKKKVAWYTGSKRQFQQLHIQLSISKPVKIIFLPNFK